jgi:sugar phosphate isomerase/epimerase
MNTIKKCSAVFLCLFLSLFTSGTAHAGIKKIAPTSPRISVQLYSVRNELTADFEGTLKQLAKAGFKGVEFANNFGNYAANPQGLKVFLAAQGLQVSGAHMHFDKFSPENFAATVAFYKAIGCTYLIISMDNRAATLEGAALVAQDLTALEAKLKPFGLHTGYHNHKQEMLRINGKTAWDVIAQHTPKSVVLEQDVAWTEAAGEDPVAVVKKNPGRFFATHYKAAVPETSSTENAIIGQDTTDWKNLINANRHLGGTQWLVIEQEVYPEGMNALQSVEASMKGLQNILAHMQ